MWTPKRVVMLVGFLVVFFIAYRVYAWFLGGIDGLPPLPTAYWPSEGDDGPIVVQEDNFLERKLRTAFGEECPELRRPIQLETHDQQVIMTAEAFELKDGLMRLSPISLALFGKRTQPGKFPEITTVRAAAVDITFDKPVSSWTDLDNRKIVGCKLLGKVPLPDLSPERPESGQGIELVNNRGTPNRDDDLVIYIPRGPLLYHEFTKPAPGKERLPEISTTDAVELTDLITKPEASRVWATGLDIYLTNEPQPAKPNAGASRTKADAVTGVERVVLKSGVRMHLFVDPNSGFLTPGKTASSAPQTSAAMEGNRSPQSDGEKTKGEGNIGRSQLVVTTKGSFQYLVREDLGIFDVPEAPAGQFPDQVQADRHQQETDKHDHLVCEHLELQLRRKTPAARPTGSPPPADSDDDRRPDLEIESARATGRQVILTSDAEMLEAHGNDFFYHAPSQQTTLKGDPEMWALKEGHEIHVPELRLANQKGAEQGTALGAGRIDLLDRQTGKRTLHARWSDKLVTTRDGKHDVLILLGNASFHDEQEGQELQAENLKIWLEPTDRLPAGSAASSDAAPPRMQHQGRRPHRLEAGTRVQVKSRDLIIHDADRLDVWFRDAADARTQPGVVPPSRPGILQKAATGQDPRSSPPPAIATTVSPGTADKPAGAPAKPPRPIDLTARVVKADIVRTGNKNELDQLWAEGVDGSVRVRQAGNLPTDRGVDIQGDTLKLTRAAEGNRLEVTGDLARVLMDRLFILGPIVTIDQSVNEAWVTGSGAMEIESNTNLQGVRLKEPVPVVISWHKSMFFNGKFAYFESHVQVTQENPTEQETSRLQCQTLKAELDKPVSLRERNKDDGPPAKIERLFCDGADDKGGRTNVRVENDVKQGEKIIKLHRLEALEVAVDNPEGAVTATGPGRVRIFQKAPADGPGAGGVPGPGARGARAVKETPPDRPPETENRLTAVRFTGRMMSNNKNHTTIFIGPVEVLHLPADDPYLEASPDRLPEGGMYIFADRKLIVYRREEGGVLHQEMEALGNVRVNVRDFWAIADEVYFNELKDQMILKATDGNQVQLYQRTPKGTNLQTAKQMIYSRKTGEFRIIQGSGARGGN